MKDRPSESIAPIVLSAGESRRMGFPKALLPVGGRTFLNMILDVLDELALQWPIVVLGFHSDRIEPLLTGRHARILRNENPHLGQLSSIQLGLRHLPVESAACLLWPVDQPFVPAALVANLIRIFRETRAPLVLPRCQGRRGHPAVIRRDLIREILALPVEAGAKPVMRKYEGEAALLETDDDSVIDDIDTPEDYARRTGRSLEGLIPGSSK